VLCGHRLAVVVSKSRKEDAKAELPWSRVHGSSALRKVLSQRAADFFFRCRFFFSIMRKRVRPGRHDDNGKRRKRRRLATKVAAVPQQAKVWQRKAVLPRLPLSLWAPYVSRWCSKCCAKSPCQSPRSLSTRRFCTSDVRQSSLFVVDRGRKGIREIRARMEKRRKAARKSNSTEQGHNQDQASSQQLRTVLLTVLY
jgi:hypothetical protein